MEQKPTTLADVPDERLAALRQRIYNFKVEPQILYLLLRGPVSDVTVGLWLMNVGVVFLLVQGVVGGLCVAHGLTSVGYMMWAIAPMGLLAAFHGYKRWSDARKILAGSARARGELEAEEGLLWHFEGFMLARTEAEELETVDSLQRACADSAGKAPVTERTDLRAYWYWIVRLKEDMRDIEACWR